MRKKQTKVVSDAINRNNINAAGRGDRRTTTIVVPIFEKPAIYAFFLKKIKSFLYLAQRR